ncbi:MAG: ABC transporter substrate-binding protein, partial [Fimbriimonadaceae bacterium]|nr:ABC transporter substrate-binding protein [Alphaproteobacteria bacterium]
LVNGEPPEFEILDPLTIRYTWNAPNPEFLPALAGASPLYIYQPSHYMKQFHPKYQDPARLAAMVEEINKRNWVGLHIERGRQYRPENPDLPSLQPWVNRTAPPADQFVFERNPFYHRVDNHGRQLPYIDQVVLNMGSSRIIPAKTGAGESDLQARYLRFDNYTFLKEASGRQDFNVRLWETAKGAQIALFPNMNVEDAGWRKLMRDVRFRRALSLAIDRHEINQVVYYGLFRESANTVLPISPLYRQEYADAWVSFDIDQANQLLDQMGLDRNTEGTRLMEDGRPLEIIMETAGESTEETDVLELVRDSWALLGIKLFVRSTQRDIFRNRVFSGQATMSTWQGLSNAIPTPAMSPAELAPTDQQHLQWPKWGQYVETSGQSGEEPDQPEVQRLVALYHEWQLSATDQERTRIWQDMLSVHADQVFTIGIVNGSLQPVVVSNRLKNVPETGFYNWDPGAYFGLYLPDTFWLEPTP